MATDYTVIIAVRQRFGDNPSGVLSGSGRDWGEYPIEHEAPFVGASKDFVFHCPRVDRSQFGVLQFNSLGVSQFNNIIQVNGVDVPGGISVGPVWIFIDPHPPLWNTHSLLIETNVLREENVLHIESVPDDFGNIDDFIIDNAVMWFKTQAGIVSPGTGPPQATEG
jgi:hypothetical protein